MNLLEFEGKALLRESGIRVPPGQRVTSPDQLQTMHYPVVIKSQVPIGGRGKSGGICVAETVDDAKEAYERIRKLRIKGYLPSAILAEEAVQIRQELYFSLSVDRRSKMELLLFSEAGGMDIEKVDKERIKAISIDPILGLQDYQLALILLHATIEEKAKVGLKQVIRGLYGVFKARKLELLEINPLVLDSAGEWVCVDSKIVLDDNLCHKNSQEAAKAPSSFEEATHGLGVNGVELEGDIALITSGAGAGLATIDELKSHGGTVRAFVDLGSLVYDRDKMMEVIELVYDLKPKVVLFNFYFQVARCDTLSEAIVNSLRDIPVVVRARGKYEEEAREMLAQHGCYATREFNDAVVKTIEMVSRERTAYGNLG